MLRLSTRLYAVSKAPSSDSVGRAVVSHQGPAPSWVEFAFSLCACIGFLQVLQFHPAEQNTTIRLIRNLNCPYGVSETTSGCLPLSVPGMDGSVMCKVNPTPRTVTLKGRSGLR